MYGYNIHNVLAFKNAFFLEYYLYKYVTTSFDRSNHNGGYN